MAGILIPDRDSETLKRYEESRFASPVPVKERQPEDRGNGEAARSGPSST
jgi:hypothetical protein